MVFKKENYLSKRLVLLIPAVGLLIVALFLVSYNKLNISQLASHIFHGLLITAAIWIGCIVIVTTLWEKYPWEQQPVKHLIIEIISITAYTLIVSYILYLIESKLWGVPVIENIGLDIVLTLLITYLITAIHESIFFYLQWKYHFSKSARLERDNISARYETLKTQINPHFLFNSLNSLTSLVEGNPAAVGYISNLSDLLRYMLKSNKKELVLLREELAVLNNYVSLQQMRYKENLHIAIDLPESCYHYALPPLSLQMLVENAIKHNIITHDRPLNVKIWTEKGSLVVENNLQRRGTTENTNRGLKNISERLALFTTRGIAIDESNGFYRVTLPLLQVEL